MFELFLNAAKFALSSDVRETASTLWNRLTQNSDWQKAFCTIEARVPFEEEERVSVLLHLAKEKLRSDGFPDTSVERFQLAAEELIQNTFEHGTKNAKSYFAKFSVEITPTYVSFSAFNPDGVLVDLPKWIDLATQHLKISKKKGRGRGIVFAMRLADKTEQVGKQGIKTVVYRESVDLSAHKYRGYVLIAVRTGLSNPSLGRRLVEEIERCISSEHFIIIPDFRDLETFNRQKNFALFEPELERIAFAKPTGEKVCIDTATGSRMGSAAIRGVLLNVVDYFDRPISVKFVTRDPAMFDLLPVDMAYQHLHEALGMIE
jgi:anti-sigma regulatory factor (Ser/Thr protein kinase)